MIVKILLSAFLIMYLNLSYSQSLSYLDLKYLIEHSIENDDSLVTTKGYLFHKTEDDKNSNCKSMIWSYRRDTHNNRALCFIARNCFEAGKGFVWYQLGEKLTFEDIKNYCKSIGYKIAKTETNPFGDLCLTYAEVKYEIEFCSGINDNTNSNEYTITLRFK